MALFLTVVMTSPSKMGTAVLYLVVHPIRYSTVVATLGNRVARPAQSVPDSTWRRAPICHAFRPSIRLSGCPSICLHPRVPGVVEITGSIEMRQMMEYTVAEYRGCRVVFPEDLPNTATLLVAGPHFMTRHLGNASRGDIR